MIFLIQNQCDLFFLHIVAYFPAISHLNYTIAT